MSLWCNMHALARTLIQVRTSSPEHPNDSWSVLTVLADALCASTKPSRHGCARKSCKLLPTKSSARPCSKLVVLCRSFTNRRITR